MANPASKRLVPTLAVTVPNLSVGADTKGTPSAHVSDVIGRIALAKAPETLRLTTKYCNQTARLLWRRYGNGRTALSFLSADFGTSLATATVNLVDQPLPDGCAHIKDWSENAGMLACLVAAGIVELVRTAPAHHAHATLCRWLVEPAESA